MMKLARRVFETARCGVTVTGSTDRRKVMKGSDFVVLTFSERNTYYRGLDTDISAKHGFRLCSADSIGPGGIFRALREIPRALGMAADVKDLAPNAWLINLVNPTAVLGIALRRFAPEVKNFALCDGHHEPRNTLMWCKRAGLLSEDASVLPPDMLNKLDLAIGGVNHFMWMVRFRYGKKDMFPAIRKWINAEVARERSDPEEWSKRRYNAHYMKQLLDIYGVCPVHIGHTKEYVPFFQGHGIKPNVPEPIRTFDAEWRARDMAAAWKTTEQYAAGQLSVRHFLKNVRDEHATDIIESMWGGLGKPFYINTDNRGAVPNMASDAFLELRSDVDMQGVRPRPFGEFPRGVLALQQQVLDAHELTAEAAATGDRRILRRALITDPLCVNIGDADACMAEMLEAQRNILPRYWYARK